MAEPSLTVFAEFRAKPGNEQELGGLLRRLIEPTRQERGCLQYELHVDDEQPGHFLFYETWTSMAELEAHAASPHFTDFQTRSAHLLAEPLRIVFASRVS
ncbi:MAG: antibiotic biosynthesis monooxygenase [Acidobacteriia bacterium]|nr:antibiotic biosynthesis monooxygenase [Terriglobia bacterium]